MSLLGALFSRPSAKGGETPVPMSSRSSSRLFGNQFSRLTGAEQQLAAMEMAGVVFGIVDRIANSVSLVDWHLWKKAKSGLKEDRVEVTSHAALDVWSKPNEFFTRQELVETCQQHQELTGEKWMLVGKNPIADLPLELWPIRPDRMEPIPDPKKYLAGYVYLSPDGERIPLERKDVLFGRRPDPRNPYRGLGPIKPILVDIESTRYAAEWNRAFFLNSAEPGGIIEIDRRLSDDEFDELRKRWAEQHQGTNQAHRVAILEQVKWVDRKYTMREMQFAELRGVTENAIRLAFGFPKFMLGDVESVNRANAEASEAMFAQWLIVPRLERWKQLLNNDFLPLFGTSASGLEFDYQDPVPANSDSENAARTSKVDAVAKLVPLGFDPAETLKVFDLPAIKFSKPEPPALPAGGPGVPGGAPGAPGGGKPFPDKPKSAWEQLTASLVNAAAPDPALARVQADWEQALAQLTTAWQPVTVEQHDALRRQVAAIVISGDLSALAAMTVPTGQAVKVLTTALLGLFGTAAQRMADELTAQGAPGVVAAAAEVKDVRATAAASVQVLAASLVADVAAEALRLAVPGADPQEVANAAVGSIPVAAVVNVSVAKRLTDFLGSVLTRVQNQARLLTSKPVPQVIYSSSEILDGNTCINCRQINGTEYPSWIAAWEDYAGGTYKNCLGRLNCRGTIVTRWNPQAGDR